MGKIVAIGGGKYDNGEIMNIARHIVSLSGKENPSVVFLPTAGMDNTDGDEPIEHAFRECGCSSYETLLLTDESLSDEKIHSTITGADVIYAGGGNLKFLMDTWKRTGVDRYVREAFDNGTVLSGLSSGAMCWFKEGYDDCGEEHAFIFIDCVGILPYCNCPHFESKSWQRFKKAIKTRSISGIACENGAAIVYDDGKYYPIHGNEGGRVFLFDSENKFKKRRLTKRRCEKMKL
ncbi:MAG: type 1 glutamine amidotransferase-like domain-containing protein [Clostridiales bacterium]|nr:type 1 glutamine amidotransferase-like domain-containing protein [Clostridiales bacterium]